MTKWKELQNELSEKLKFIEETLPHSLSDFSLEQIQVVQEQLKTLEEKIKEKQKNVQVSLTGSDRKKISSFGLDCGCCCCD